jgi:hypothetical protein
VAFAFDVMQEGLKILRKWEVLKEDKSKDKEKNPSLEFVAKGAVQQKAFQGSEGFDHQPQLDEEGCFCEG